MHYIYRQPVFKISHHRTVALDENQQNRNNSREHQIHGVLVLDNEPTVVDPKCNKIATHFNNYEIMLIPDNKSQAVEHNHKVTMGFK